jgi:hypothetical protein
MTSVPAVLGEARALLSTLTITDPVKGRSELEDHNTRRRTVWGDRAAILPVFTGLAAEVFGAIERCIADDFGLRGARELALEKVHAVEAGEATRERLDSMPAGYRKKIEKKLAAHRGQDPGALPVRKLVLTVSFEGSFGRHEVVRIGDTTYASMACSVTEAVPVRRPMTRGMKVALSIAGLWLTIGTGVAIFNALSRPPSPRELLSVPSSSIRDVRLGDTPARAAFLPHDYFSRASAVPQLGRLFVPGRDVVQVVLTDAYWRQRFQRSPSVLGQPIAVDGQPGIIVGVTPEGFPEKRVDVFVNGPP